MTKCDSCIHSDVCQYVLDMIQYNNELKIITDSYQEMLDNQILDYEIKCEKYQYNGGINNEN